MLAISLEDTIVALRQLHPPPSNLVPRHTFDYQPEQTFVLDRILFAQALAIAPHLSLGGLSGMVYEHLSRCFILGDPSLRFSELFEVDVIVVRGDIPRWVTLVLGERKLLAMVKDINGICLIVVGDVFF